MRIKYKGKTISKSDTSNCGCCLALIILFLAIVFGVAGLFFWALGLAFPDANISFWGVLILSIVLGLIIALWK